MFLLIIYVGLNTSTIFASVKEKNNTIININMKRILGIALSALALAVGASAQDDDELQKKINRENVVEGMVINNAGDTLKGYLKKMHIPTAKELGYNPNDKTTYIVGDFTPEVEFGAKLKFISYEDFNAKKHVHNNDYTECKPKKYKGYIYDVKGENIEFVTLKVKDGVGKPQEQFVRVVQDLPNGDRYIEYYMPVALITVMGEAPSYEDVEPYIHTHKAVFIKSQGYVSLVEDLKPEEFYKTRCPEIAKKWSSNAYTDVSKKKDGALNKLARLAAKVDSGAQSEARIKAFDDYLNTCGSVK